MRKKKALSLIGRILRDLTIAFIGFLVFPVVFSLFQDPIGVSPARIKLNPPVGSAPKIEVEYAFNLINRKNKSFYGTWLRITPSVTKGLGSRIEIVPSSVRADRLIEIQERFWCLDILRFDGFDLEGQQHIWLNIREIEPNQKMKFILILETVDIIDKIPGKLSLYMDVIENGQQQPIPFTFQGDLEKGEIGLYVKSPQKGRIFKQSALSFKKRPLRIPDNLPEKSQSSP